MEPISATAEAIEQGIDWMLLLRSLRPSLAIFFGGLLAGWLGKAIFLRRLRALSERTTTRTDDHLVDAIGRYWFAFALLVAAIPALHVLPVRESVAERVETAQTWLIAAAILVFTLAVARFVGLWFGDRERDPATGAARPSLLAKASRGAVLLIGLMLALSNAGLQVGPLLTALGVGSLAIGLALQPTLSNFFAGIYLSMSKPIRVGDFIELDDGTQGEVVDIGWRATKVRQLANNLAIIPNSRLGEMRILNYSMPEMPQSVPVECGVAYGSDLRRVERVALEEAAAVQQTHELADRTFEPALRFHTFGDSSINFTVFLRANTVLDRFAVRHEFVMRIKERLEREGIEIPFPQRVVHLPEGGEGKLSREG